MMHLEGIREVFNSISQNKTRTILAGFGVAWGIYILVILLGVGQGFQNGVKGMFGIFAQKSFFVFGAQTSMKYRNMKEGMEVSFDENFMRILQKHFPEINSISPEFIQPNSLVRHENNMAWFNISGVNSDFFRIKLLHSKTEGRLFSDMDIYYQKNVVVIGESVEETLFGHKSAIGKFININETYYQVIGILESDNIFSIQERNAIYLPVGAFIRNINRESHFKSFCLIISGLSNSRVFERNLRNYLASKIGYDIDDAQAVYIANIEAQTSIFERLFNGLEIFIWCIGLCFLLSGIVGISNIMLIIVKERTSEIGIRKAVGALPKTIINLILSEAIIITILSGLIGLVLGTCTLYIIDLFINALISKSILIHTSLNFPVIVFSLIVLILSGIIAGLFPAIKAAQIMPVDAIRYENRG